MGGVSSIQVYFLFFLIVLALHSPLAGVIADNNTLGGHEDQSRRAVSNCEISEPLQLLFIIHFSYISKMLTAFNESLCSCSSSEPS